jgi:hypothetical protein
MFAEDKHALGLIFAPTVSETGFLSLVCLLWLRNREDLHELTRLIRKQRQITS